jgi:hypothetical protein
MFFFVDAPKAAEPDSVTADNPKQRGFSRNRDHVTAGHDEVREQMFKVFGI